MSGNDDNLEPLSDDAIPASEGHDDKAHIRRDELDEAELDYEADDVVGDTGPDVAVKDAAAPLQAGKGEADVESAAENGSGTKEEGEEKVS